jgi:DNA polymerase-3 subunit delta'
VRTLSRALSEDRIPNAYLFEGPSGVGKQATALALAQARLCPEKPGKGCLSCPVCTRIRAGLHPDVRTFAPRAEGSRNIPVEFVRTEILRVAQFAPFEAPAAFLIFPEADVSFPEVHPEAANALLKTLEEPRPNLCFVLISERPERLLTTIRSRCQRLRFGRLPELVLAHVLETEGVPEAQHEAAIALAEGQADRALALAKDGLAAHLLSRALRVEQTLASRQPGRMVQLSEELSKADDCLAVLEMLSLVYRDAAAHALGVSDLHLSSARAEITALAARIGPAKAAANVQKLAELPELLARNANLQITLDQLLLALAA